MQSAVFSVSAAASTSEGFNSSFAPLTTMIRFCPEGSTKIGATPLDTPLTWRTCVASIPSFSKFLMVDGPNRSSPTRATMKTSAPQSRAATAWFAPFPPNPRSNFWPKMVSPGFGNSSENVVKSTLALPTTAIRGRFAIIFRFEVRKAECSQTIVAVSTRAGASRATTGDTGVHRETQRYPSQFPENPCAPCGYRLFWRCNLIHLASAHALEYSLQHGDRLAVRTVG